MTDPKETKQEVDGSEENIHQAINAVMKEVGYVQKQSAPTLKYTYAGEASLIEALRPSMVAHGIYMHVQQVKKIYREQYTTNKGTLMANTMIEGVVRFTHISGSFIDVEATGEGADSGDKSSNKAMTGLYKYALRQTFCIETGDDPDRFPSDEMERTGNSSTIKPRTKSQDTPKSRQEAPGATEEEKPTQDTPNGAGMTPGEFLKNVMVIKQIGKNTGKPTVEVIKYLNTLGKDVKFTPEEIETMIGEAG